MMREIAGLSVIAAMIGGCLVPAYLIFRFTKHMLRSAPVTLHSSSIIEEKTIKIMIMIGLILAALPGFGLSLTFGGVGGSFAENITTRLGLGSSGVPFGIFLGMVIYICGVVGSGILIGAVMGKIFGFVLSKTIMKKA